MDQGVLERDAGKSLNKLLRQLVVQAVCHREWHEDRECEQHNEMLARVEEFDGDDDKLLVEHQQDINIDIGIESELPKLEFDQELKDCAEEPRRVLRRVLRRESLRESLRAWLRVQVCPHAERECCVRALGNQLSVDKFGCKRMRQKVVHNSVALDKTNASADSASAPTPLT